MTRVKFKVNGRTLEESILIDEDFIRNNESIEFEIYEYFNKNFNTCVCSLNESQAYCDCTGKYGEEVEISEIFDEHEAQLKIKDEEIADLRVVIDSLEQRASMYCGLYKKTLKNSK